LKNSNARNHDHQDGDSRSGRSVRSTNIWIPVDVSTGLPESSHQHDVMHAGIGRERDELCKDQIDTRSANKIVAHAVLPTDRLPNRRIPISR
jgi:hypothetical protein